MAPDTVKTSSTIFQGWLYKRGGFQNKKWQKRWFVITDDEKMAYSKNEGQCEQRGFIDIGKATKLCAVPGGTEAEFRIHTPDRLWEMKALSKRSRETWLNKIQKNVKNPPEIEEENKTKQRMVPMRDSNPPMGSTSYILRTSVIKQGWLYKRGGNGKSYKKRWFIFTSEKAHMEYGKNEPKYLKRGSPEEYCEWESAGFIDVTEATSLVPVSNSKLKPNTEFRIYTPTRVWELKALCDKDCETWIETLKDNSGKLDRPTSSSLSSSGGASHSKPDAEYDDGGSLLDTLSVGSADSPGDAETDMPTSTSSRPRSRRASGADLEPPPTYDVMSDELFVKAIEESRTTSPRTPKQPRKISPKSKKASNSSRGVKEIEAQYEKKIQLINEQAKREVADISEKFSKYQFDNIEAKIELKNQVNELEMKIEELCEENEKLKAQLISLGGGGGRGIRSLFSLPSIPYVISSFNKDATSYKEDSQDNQRGPEEQRPLKRTPGYTTTAINYFKR